MKDNLIKKLQIELNKEITTEPQVIYILSRIRKIIEIDNKKIVYAVLNFYCNWALHTRINDTDAIRDTLVNLEKDINAHVDFVTHRPFKNELNTFLRENRLTTSIFNNALSLNMFNGLLIQIYSDTPLILETETEIITTTIRDVSKNGMYELNIVRDKIMRN